jgi:hypothetical protein
VAAWESTLASGAPRATDEVIPFARSNTLMKKLLSIPAWLESVGFGAYSASFLEQGIDEHLLSTLSDQDLQVLGVRLLGDRKRLLGLIAARAVDAAEPERRAVSSHLELGRGASSEAGQRRQLTVMFCDLEGSTALSRRVDAEDFREITLRFHNTVRTEAEAFPATSHVFLATQSLSISDTQRRTKMTR